VVRAAILKKYGVPQEAVYIGRLATFSEGRALSR
jgi:hypothetical protein